MPQRRYIVSVATPSGTDMGPIVEALCQAGFDVDQQLDAAGVIVGRAEDDVVARVRSLPGVTAIEEERTFELPPGRGEV